MGSSDGRRTRSKVPSSRATSRTMKHTGGDTDLDEILAEVSQVEARTNHVLQSLQRDITTCCNYMLEALLSRTTTAVENLKMRMEDVRKLRDANNKAENQFSLVRHY